MTARSRVVVAAPYPPMGGPEAAATLAMVRSLLDGGDLVTVVSPLPSAAHRHLDLGGARGAARLASLAWGAERLIVRLDAAAMVVSADPPRALPGRLGLAFALRRAGRGEVLLDRVPGTVSRRWASLVLGGARRVVVATDEERASLVAAGVAPQAVEVDPALRPLPARPGPSADHGPLPTSAAELQDLVERRAASQRATGEPARRPGACSASLPLSHLVRMEPALPTSSKPAGRLVKRLLGRLLAWQFDNVIQQVNRLHQATIDSVELLGTESGAIAPDSVPKTYSSPPDTLA